MTNAELILLLGIGLLSAGVGLSIPPWPTRPIWVTPLFGVIAAVLGGIVFLTVALR
jgi:tetrahydromethanopterin S-methyltransferase subunit C